MDELSHSPYSGQCKLLLILVISLLKLYIYSQNHLILICFMLSIDLYSEIHSHGLIFPVVFDMSFNF